ncbi:hypothetical protein ACFFKE_02750 [Streptomyces mutabilis]|uniref:hypothetical protein n=1 Tax=Streptomyces mutabilis TaxID=67332 RepID=UPI00177E0675|nr:hypothetical protein [Streptomyces mutabilis]GGP98483.1 hypothetical protein GCM10010279_01460 [Streptomyces mutabilis]
MSDVTRQPGGTPAEQETQYPGARGAAVPDTGRAAETPPAPGARADHAAGARADTTPGARADGAALPRPTGESTTPTGTPTGVTGAVHGGGALLPHEACDELGQRLQHAVAGFVDAPRASVEEADRVLEEITARFTDAVAHRRRTLRTSWHDTGPGDRATSTDTEQLRLALRDYRELADRLMRL